MTIEEFEALIQKAEKQLGETLSPSRSNNGRWSVMKTGPSFEDVDDGTLMDVVAKLQEWATPPKPETVTITVPYAHASWYAKNGGNPAVLLACKEAIAPYEQAK